MKKIYACCLGLVMLIAFNNSAFSQTTTRSLTWNLTGTRTWPTVAAGNTWDNKANWKITGTAGTVPATNVTNGDLLIIPNTAGVVINVTADMVITYSNLVIEVDGNGLINLQSGVDLTLQSGSTAFSLYRVTAGNGLTLEKRSPPSNATQLILNGVVKALNTSVNSTLSLTSTDSRRALGGDPTAASATGFGGFLFGALPVVLGNFSANLSTGNKVVISWTTTQEINTDRFDVEKSIDGISWQSIATQKATGFSAAPVSYSATDEAPFKGSNFYRIIVRDIDGKTSISAIRNVRLSALGKVNVYPNPASNTVNVSLSDVPRSEWTITVINNAGQVVLQKKYSKSTTLVNLPVSTYPNGNYTLEITDGAVKQQNKLMISHQ
jgi:Secretion system C-terminal sorting domain